MYSFLQPGEFIQITLEDQGRVSGFVSRYGSLDSDRGALLDQFFKSGSLRSNQLAFVTEQVHSIWYEFQGTVDRGPGKRAEEEGFYVLKGTLTEHITHVQGKSSARQRDVVFRSLPQDVPAEHGKRD